MRITNVALSLGLLAGASLLAACGNPEKSAQKAVEKATADWAEARESLDPQKRVKSYDAVIKDVEAVGKKYKKTPVGAAIAAGRSAGGADITSMKAQRDVLAERADCYADPNAECLKPFASSSYSGDNSYQNSPEGAFGRSQQAICEKGFKAADAELEDFKINKPVYAQQLMQVAMAASACDKPEEVRAAMAAYWSAEPAQGADRISAQLSVLATDQLEAAWPSILAELDAGLKSGALDPNTAANVALTMAVRYAELGDAKAAIEKYDYFTETLNYQADWSSRLNLAKNLIIAGEAEKGLSLVENPNQKNFSVITLNQAAAELGRRMKLTRDSSSGPNLTAVKDINEYLAPVGGADKARYAQGAATVEAELDKLTPTLNVRDGAIGPSGVDTAYGALALVQQKLGAPDKANALLAKGVAAQNAILQRSAQEAFGEDYLAPFQTIVALGQGKPEEAAAFAKLIRVRHDYAKLILKGVAASGDAEKALTVANELSPGAHGSNYQTIIDGLVEAEKFDQAEDVVAAYPGGPDEKNNFYWYVAGRAASQGDVAAAEKIAEKHDLLGSSIGRLRLAQLKMSSEKIAGDRRKAEPIIREIFTLGEEIDASNGSNDLIAQNAARYAFDNGYTDLGIELYQAASRKDQRPLFGAFNDKAKPKDLTAVFMLAQDNLSGEQLGYVIDNGIRHLSAK